MERFGSLVAAIVVATAGIAASTTGMLRLPASAAATPSTNPLVAMSSPELIVKLKPEAELTLGRQSWTARRSARAGTESHSFEAGSALRPQFSQATSDLRSLHHRLAATVGTQAPDLSRYYQLRARDAKHSAKLLASLAAAGIVETAYPQPEPLAPPVTPDYSSQQGYEHAAPDGMNTTDVNTIPGGRGENVKIFDVEYSWNQAHEDLTNTVNGLIFNGTPVDPFGDDNHGTAVLGVLGAVDNGFGVIGEAPSATLGMVNADNTDGYNPANAINIARQHMGPGDVMVLEQQSASPNGGYAPIEWLPDVYDAIKTATASGIIVVEAAGNGSENLDDASYNNYFNRATHDSGAIIVGAGSCSATHSRLSFSDYGARVDLQGWGECVTTTGYGYLSAVSHNQLYTNSFNGTSSATATIGGAAALVSSVLEERNQRPATPVEVRSLLVSTGTPQDPASPHIGPLPNLSAAVATTPGQPRQVLAIAGDASATVQWTSPASNGGSAITGYLVTVSPGGATSSVDGVSTSTTVAGLTNGVTYTFTVRARNAVGEGPLSASSNPVTPATSPGAPVNVTATAGNASASVSWLASGNGGSPITQYAVAATPSGATRVVGGSSTNMTFDGLLNGTTYTFTVRARNAVGDGPLSASSNPVTPAEVPGAPVNVTATAGNATASVSWVPPTDTGGSPIDGYTVIASPGGQQVNVAPSATSATVAGLANGTTYTFTVRANNAIGLGPPSAPSNAVTPNAPVVPAVPVVEVKPETVTRSGYWMLDASGNVYGFGDAKYFGGAATAMSPAVFGLAAVHVEPTPSGNGYWVVDSLGRVYSFGDATWFGNADRSRFAAGERASSFSATASGRGYWIFTSRGRVVPFGDAAAYGDMAATILNGPVLGSIATPSGKGYYMVASDGGIFAFGDAVFYGSMGGTPLNAPVQSLVPTADGKGYWLVASDGGIFAFGDATFRGSMGSTHLNRAVVGMVRFGDGYLMVGADGGIFDFSDKPFLGSLGNNPSATPITSVAAING